MSSKKRGFKYIEKAKPSLETKKFAPGFISKESRTEFGSIFSKDARDFYFAVDTAGRSEIRWSKLINGSWSKPIAIITHPIYSFNDPCLSPDEEELYYISNMPVKGKSEKKDFDIWYSKKENGNWSRPINAGKQINSPKNEFYISFTEKEKMYFATNKSAAENRGHDFDIYTAVKNENGFQQAIKLGEAINTKRYEADVFIAPDESYIIFCSARKDGFGKGDLYISFKDKKGNWTKAKNMGPSINSASNEICPFVSKDGKYFFYTSNNDIYWLNSKILKQYK